MKLLDQPGHAFTWKCTIVATMRLSVNCDVSSGVELRFSTKAIMQEITEDGSSTIDSIPQKRDF